MLVPRLALAFALVISNLMGSADAITGAAAEPGTAFRPVAFATRTDGICRAVLALTDSPLPSHESAQHDDQAEIPDAPEDDTPEDLGETINRGGRPTPLSGRGNPAQPIAPAAVPRLRLPGRNVIRQERPRFLLACRLLF